MLYIHYCLHANLSFYSYIILHISSTLTQLWPRFEPSGCKTNPRPGFRPRDHFWPITIQYLLFFVDRFKALGKLLQGQGFNQNQDQPFGSWFILVSWVFQISISPGGSFSPEGWKVGQKIKHFPILANGVSFERYDCPEFNFFGFKSLMSNDN